MKETLSKTLTHGDFDSVFREIEQPDETISLHLERIIKKVALIKVAFASNTYKLCNHCRKKIPIKANVCPYCLREVGYNGALGANVLKPRGIMERLLALMFGVLFVITPFFVILIIIFN